MSAFAPAEKSQMTRSGEPVDLPVKRLGSARRLDWLRQGALVRPNTFGEDASRVRTGNAPAVLAAIRNIVTTALRLSGADNIAVTRCAAALDPTGVAERDYPWRVARRRAMRAPAPSITSSVPMRPVGAGSNPVEASRCVDAALVTGSVVAAASVLLATVAGSARTVGGSAGTVAAAAPTVRV
jgi:hypothetical protein